MSTFLRFPGFKRKAVTLSYDDGTLHDKKLVEIMQKYGLKGTFNLDSELFPAEPSNYKLSAEEAVELFNGAGMEVAVHGAKHLSLSEMDPAVATRDVLVDRENLEKIFGKIIRGMAYACGKYNSSVTEMLRHCGIDYARTTIATHSFALPTNWLELSPTCHHNDARLFELVDSFINTEEHSYFWRNKPMLFFLWGHSFEFKNNDNWDVIEKFGEKIGGRDDIWYATNGEIFSYVQAFNRLHFSTNLEYIENPSAIDVYVNIIGKERVVPAGQTIKI